MYDRSNRAPLPNSGTIYDSSRPVNPTTGGKLYWGYDHGDREWAWRNTQYGPNGRWSEQVGGRGGHYTPVKK